MQCYFMLITEIWGSEVLWLVDLSFNLVCVRFLIRCLNLKLRVLRAGDYTGTCNVQLLGTYHHRCVPPDTTEGLAQITNPSIPTDLNLCSLKHTLIWAPHSYRNLRHQHLSSALRNVIYWSWWQLQKTNRVLFETYNWILDLGACLIC